MSYKENSIKIPDKRNMHRIRSHFKVKLTVEAIYIRVASQCQGCPTALFVPNPLITLRNTSDNFYVHAHNLSVTGTQNVYPSLSHSGSDSPQSSKAYFYRKAWISNLNL